MGIPLFFKSLLSLARGAIVKHGQIGNVSSVSIDLNGLLHKAFSLIYMISITDKSKELMKIGTRLIKEGKVKKDKEMIQEGNDLIEESKLLDIQYEEGNVLITKGEKLVAQGREKQGQWMIRDGENVKKEKFYIRRKGLSEDLIEKYEEDYHQKVWELIKGVLEEFGDIKTLILAVDGVAPLAKIYQQKQRRSKAAVNNKADINFDSNVITPATPFMIRLDEFIQNQIKIDRKILPEKVIYSGHMNKNGGEGEHKIFQYFRDGEMTGLNGNHIVYGLDADLIMLALLSPQQNIILSRESQEDMIHINYFKNYLIDTLRTKTAIQDFVIMIYLLGNDFIRHSPSLDVSADTINMMLDIYKRGKYKFVDNGNIDIENFTSFIDQLSNEESGILENLSKRDDYHSTALESAKVYGFDLNIYREVYYEKEFGTKSTSKIPALNDLFVMSDDKIEKMVQDYMKTICWNFVYYTEGTLAINSQWMYQYNHAPMLVDLAMMAKKKIKGYRAFKGMTQFSPIHQLVSVLPQKSIHIVPDELKSLFKTNSPIYDLFPLTFINDKEGKIMKKRPGLPLIDHGIAIIPLIDQRRIIDIVSTIYFSEERLLLWQPQSDLISIDIHPFKGKPINKTYEYQQPYKQTQQYQQTQQTYQPKFQQYQPKSQPKTQQTYQPKTQQTYQPKSQQYQPKTQQYQPKSQQYQQTYQPKTQQYQQTQPRQQYQPKTQQYQQTYQPKTELKETEEVPIIIKNVPPMLNLELLQHFIKTGKTPNKKTAKDLIFEEDWS